MDVYVGSLLETCHARMMTRDDLRELLVKALRHLIIEEWDLAVVDAHERTITTHLSRLITNVGLAEWIRVDHDYGRHHSDPKRAQITPESGDKEKLLIPDILIHRRGFDSDNLLALEAKKVLRDDPSDEAKLRSLLRQPYNYAFGVLLDFGITSSADQSLWKPRWCWFSKPTEHREYERVFDEEVCSRLNDEGRRRWHQRRYEPLDSSGSPGV